ncbi:MAG: hypothetical protein KDC80_15565 [Saprospiraceae bacterium]|nr:hypothetical protein [Saprospiraceae bacterium]
MNTKRNVIAAIGLGIGVVFGMSGLAFDNPRTQLIFWVISGVGFTTGLALMAVKYLQQGKDLAAAGFLLFSIAECISTLTAAAEKATSDATFAGCMLFYTVGFFFICLPNRYAMWIRITGIISASLFLVAACRFYLGYGISPNDTLPGIAYGFLTVTILGFILDLRQVTESKSTTMDKIITT